MMKLERVRNTSATVVTLADGIEVLYSYSTPVACRFESCVAWKTGEKYSRTTTRHVNEWVDGDAIEVDQGWIDGVAEGLCTGPFDCNHDNH